MEGGCSPTEHARLGASLPPTNYEELKDGAFVAAELTG
jgi:hypothetical protein